MEKFKTEKESIHPDFPLSLLRLHIHEASPECNYTRRQGPSDLSNQMGEKKKLKESTYEISHMISFPILEKKMDLQIIQHNCLIFEDVLQK
jgi:hypothetical protein